MSKESLYNCIQTIREDRKNLGFKYDEDDVLLKKSLSPVLYRNTKIIGFLNLLNKQILEMINLPKRIKTFVNFAEEKDTNKIN